MLIELDKITEIVIPCFKGGEKNFFTHMFDDGANKIMKARLEPGASIGMHTHEGSCEIIFILQGDGKVKYDDTEETLSAGSCHYCPEGHAHSLINNSDKDLVFLAVVPKQ